MASRNENLRPFVLTAERIVAMHQRMTDEERNALALWEKANVRGDGTLGTSDWPGWISVIHRLSH